METLAKALKGLGVGKRDVVVMYLPMIPALAVSMLAMAAAVGAIHFVVCWCLRTSARRPNR